MKGSWIPISAKDGGTVRAYLSLPKGGTGPGMVVLQEIFGISPSMQAVADLYAEEGYVTVVPDLFWRLEPGVSLGYDEAAFTKARDLNARFDAKASIADMAATVAMLRAHPAVNGKVGAIGFCLGGRLAVLAAAYAGVDCAIGYYGVGIEKEPEAMAQVKCPMVLHFAGKDAYTPPEVIEKITDAFLHKLDVEI